MTRQKSRIRNWSGSLPYMGAVISLLIVIAATCWVGLGSIEMGLAQDIGKDQAAPSSPGAVKAESADAAAKSEQREPKIEDLEKLLRSIKTTGEASEWRSYENKLMARELIRFVKLIVAILVAIAVIFPFTVWLIARSKFLGLSGLSTEVTQTLVDVEERQAKLANILKDIQSEIDYLHTMSVPDLKSLIQQAEAYLKQNERDLEASGLRRGERQ